MPIKISSDVFKRFGGIYVISGRKDGTYKIGLSTNLHARLNGYHNCFPTGFWINNILILENYGATPFSKLDPEMKTKIRERLRRVEKGIGYRVGPVYM